MNSTDWDTPPAATTASPEHDPELIRWTLAYPDPATGNTRLATPADLPAIHALIAAGIRHDSYQPTSVQEPWIAATLAVAEQLATGTRTTATNPTPHLVTLFDLDDRAYISAATWSDTPPELLDAIANYPDCAKDVAANRSTSPTTLERLTAQHPDNIELIRRVAANPNTPGDVLTKIALGYRTVASGTPIICVAANPSTPAATLDRLAASSPTTYGATAAAIAANPSARPALLAGLLRATYHNPMMAADLASNPATPLATLLELATNPAATCRAAGNPKMPADQLAEYARSANESLRQAVARNPNTPPEMLAELANDPVSTTRAAALRNPNTPPAELTTAIDLGDLTVTALAANPSTPAVTLIELAVGDWADTAVPLVMANPGTPVEVLEHLANTADFWQAICPLIPNRRLGLASIVEALHRTADAGPGQTGVEFEVAIGLLSRIAEIHR